MSPRVETSDSRPTPPVVARELPLPRRAPGPRPPGPFRAEFWRSPLRGAWLTSFLGTLLVPTITAIAVTGFVSHWAYHPELSGNATVNPSFDIPSLFEFPQSWPSWDYAVTQGAHVTLGLMTVPLILAKLWSVIPRFFRLPTIRDLAGTIERLSLVLLVGSVLVEFATGILATQDYYPLRPGFFAVHYYGAWVFGTMFVLHACVKFPVVRQAYRSRGILRPLRDGLRETRPESPASSPLAPVNPATPTISRRGLLATLGAASLTILAVQAGESIGGPFRRFALMAPRGRVFGSGPDDFPVTTSAAAAQIRRAATGGVWRLTVSGARTTTLSMEQLLAMPQVTETLTISCTEGWSTTQRWTGVRLIDLARLVGAPSESILHNTSLQLTGLNASKRLSPEQWNDMRALLALRVNGADLSLDHGYPARVIVPGGPGVHNTKWVRELTFEPA